jgi:hypothetical protein
VLPTPSVGEAARAARTREALLMRSGLGAI